MIIERARAKINLTLHVYPPRADGYHPLESLVMFAGNGDDLAAVPADAFSLTIDGPFADGLSTAEDNLILRAATASGHPPAAFHLTKNLPVASGIGGGSADAAAALRLMRRLYGPIENIDAIALSIGADVPVCLLSKTSVMSGIGEAVFALESNARYPAVLVNPRVAVSTGVIFKAYDAEPQRYNAPEYSALPQDILQRALGGQNDLESVACRAAPVISQALDLLRAQSGERLARMSGSGATCFAIFETEGQAQIAAKAISLAHPDWWCRQTILGNLAPAELT